METAAGVPVAAAADSSSNNNQSQLKASHGKKSSSSNMFGAHHSGMVVFSAALARDLSAQRFAPVYVGVRRVRPSSRFVLKAMTSSSSSLVATTTASPEATTTTTVRTQMPPPLHSSNGVVYKLTTDDGDVRRMTAQEKRHAKMQEKILAKKRKLEAKSLTTSHEGIESESVLLSKNPPQHATTSTTSSRSDTRPPSSLEAERNDNTDNADRYYVWPCVHASALASAESSSSSSNQVAAANLLAEELADLRGERDGVPPVMLPPALARLVPTTTTMTTTTTNGCVDNNNNDDHGRISAIVIPDDGLAHQWAMALSTSMQTAERVRQSETDWRPMPYRLVPEVWNRLRPVQTKRSPPQVTIPRSLDSSDAPARMDSRNHHHHQQQPVPSTESTGNKMDGYARCSIRPPSLSTSRRRDDDDEAAIVELLFRHTNLHISCGAKFGCDYLLYDGPRSERHAFAGLRIITNITTTAAQHRTTDDGTIAPTSTPPYFPLPSAYDLTGYVRCLNTAGKLALLATVIRDSDDENETTVDVGDCNDDTPNLRRSRWRVLLVDLALVKVAATTSKRPRKTMEQRVKNLAKSTTPNRCN